MCYSTESELRLLDYSGMNRARQIESWNPRVTSKNEGETRKGVLRHTDLEASLNVRNIRFLFKGEQIPTKGLKNMSVVPSRRIVVPSLKN